jgi:hypothetical protein
VTGPTHEKHAVKIQTCCCGCDGVCGVFFAAGCVGCHTHLDKILLVDMATALVAITRENLDRISIEAWMALCEYPNEWDPVSDVIEWQLPAEIWTFFILKYPELVANQQHK